MKNMMLKRVFILGAMALVAGLSVQNSRWLNDDETAGVAASSQIESKVADVAKMKIVESYGKTPMGFEENIGQTDERVKFMTRGQGYSLFLTPAEAVLVLSKQSARQDEINKADPGADEKRAESTESRVLRLSMAGANPSPEIVGVDKQSGNSNYIRGNDRSQWQTGISRYDRVRYSEVYAGIDLAFYGNQKRLEYDFIVKPGASPETIHLAFSGADRQEIDAEGNLILHLGDDQVIQHAPLTYQMVNGERQSIESSYMLAENGEVAFEVAAYDAGKDLIIDPTLVYSTYFGGYDADDGYGIAVDGSGNAYVTGYTRSTDYPTVNAVQATTAGGVDAFVTKLDAAGAPVYSTYLGGTGDD
jgi:hypothetical protein